MGERKVDRLGAFLEKYILCPAAEVNLGCASLFVDHFDIREIPARTETEPQGFAIGFFGRESCGEMRVRVGLFPAVKTFTFRKHTLLEVGSLLLENPTDTLDGDDVNSVAYELHRPQHTRISAAKELDAPPEEDSV